MKAVRLAISVFCAMRQGLRRVSFANLAASLAFVLLFLFVSAAFRAAATNRFKPSATARTTVSVLGPIAGSSKPVPAPGRDEQPGGAGGMCR
jgi:hypothetical protein